jgi:hypothetical protein
MTLLDILPKNVQLPSWQGVNGTGDDDYEWYTDVYTLLSLTVHKNGKVTWAALIGNEDPRGSFLLEDGWPSYLTDIVNRITT